MKSVEESASVEAGVEEPTRFEEIAREASGVPVVKLVSTIVEGAVNSGATDIHLDPQDPDRVLGVVPLRNAALSVSAPHGRWFESEHGVRSHVLDPATGDSVSRGLLAAVIAPSATTADAWSTASLVLGERGVLPARRDFTVLIHRDDARPEVRGVEPALFESFAAPTETRSSIP